MWPAGGRKKRKEHEARVINVDLLPLSLLFEDHTHNVKSVKRMV
jgi:hypothetical protein